MTRLLLLVGFICFAAFAGLPYQGETAEFSQTSHFYQVEYLKPVTGDVSIVNIIFSAPVSSDLAERFLRQEIDRASNYSSSKGKIMAFAWVRTGSNMSDEYQVKLPDESKFLIYKYDMKQILTAKEYYIAQFPKTEPNKVIHVTIDINLQRNPAGKIRVVAETNLPDNMRMGVWLRNREIGYSAQDRVSVNRGNFESKWFSNRGKALPSGTYEISISSPFPDLLADSVRRVIGKKGENLVGDMIVFSYGSNQIDMKVKRQID